MASLVDLVDMYEEREVFESASSTLPSNPVSDDLADDEDEDDAHLLQSRDHVDADELYPLPPFTLDEFKVAMERVYEFVCIHKPFVQQASRSSLRDYANDADALRDAISSMTITSSTIQPRITSFFAPQHD
jgi:hypothetical protein